MMNEELIKENEILKEKLDFYEQQAKNLLPEVWTRFVEAYIQASNSQHIIIGIEWADDALEAFKERFTLTLSK